ncbi:DCC1-like thiol-disulfide oxidoreductase family [Dillenia turbinata]|uniref:DCC1-like thiol-disulfide oxidoreductase family n=1 Tax=Dillenia turbinata TaxID=194707 RepID=A0AAN8V4R8_9MAGN
MALRAAATVAATICFAKQKSSISLLSPHPILPFLKSKSLSPTQIGYKYHFRAIQSETAEPITPSKEDEEKSQPPSWKIKMLYDGDCPLCMREVNMLKERNKQYGAIKFVDISADDYSPEENQGLHYKTVMGTIHAILSDGTVVTNVEVYLGSLYKKNANPATEISPTNRLTHMLIALAFRRLYEEVGLGWVYAFTKYEPLATIADAVYGVWAKYRLKITGRPPLEEVLEARKKNELCNDTKACKM